MPWLAHHGIKGQKWGVRRYQNLDGSLTPLGKERYKQYEDQVYDKLPDGSYDMSANKIEDIHRRQDRYNSEIENKLLKAGVIDDLSSAYGELSKIANAKYFGEPPEKATSKDREALQALRAARKKAKDQMYNADPSTSSKRKAELENAKKQIDTQINDIYNKYRYLALRDFMEKVPDDLRDEAFVWVRENIYQEV